LPISHFPATKRRLVPTSPHLQGTGGTYRRETQAELACCDAFLELIAVAKFSERVEVAFREERVIAHKKRGALEGGQTGVDERRAGVRVGVYGVTLSAIRATGDRRGGRGVLLGRRYNGPSACVIGVLEKLAQDGGPWRIFLQQPSQPFCEGLSDIEALCHFGALQRSEGLLLALLGFENGDDRGPRGAFTVACDNSSATNA